MTGQDLSIKFIEIAQRCQYIWQSLKKANQNKFISEKMAEQQRIFKPISNQQTFNLIQTATLTASSNKLAMSAVSLSKLATLAVVIPQNQPRLTNVEMTQLRTKNRYF